MLHIYIYIYIYDISRLRVKIRPVEAELFHSDGLTDVTKLIATFHNSANAPNKTFFSTKNKEQL